jgi:hypothetical protein
MRRIEIGCLCRDQIKSDAHERAQEAHRLENLDGTVGKLFSQPCSFLFVEESRDHMPQPPPLKSKLRQYPFSPSWTETGKGGIHE